jgi:hypothetical protein
MSADKPLPDVRALHDRVDILATLVAVTNSLIAIASDTHSNELRQKLITNLDGVQARLQDLSVRINEDLKRFET